MRTLFSPRVPLTLVLTALATLLMLAVGQAPVAHAATFTASSTADAPDANLGDGLCLTSGNACALRAAIQQANALGGPSPHTIVLLGGATYTLTRASLREDNADIGDLDINTNLNIVVTPAGSTAVVQGDVVWHDRVFDVQSGTVQMDRLEIKNGHVGEDRGGYGGGIFNGTASMLTVTNSTISGNSAAFNGAGISNNGALTLINTTVSGNHSSQNGAGISNQGGLTLTNSTVSGNSASLRGGGIFNTALSTVSLTNSTISGNSAGVGGGIFHSNGGIFLDVLRTMSLTNTTVSGNSASAGGGIFNTALSTVSLINSTISGNSTTFRGGGGIFNDTVLSTISLTDSTISDNVALQDGGGIRNLGTLTVRRSTISGNLTDRDGAGIWNEGGLTALNSTISGNRAKVNGGGIWTSGTVVTNNATIAANTADSDGNATGDGGGVFNPAGGSVTIANTILGFNADSSPALKFPDCVGTLTSRGHNLIQSTAGCTIQGSLTGNITSPVPRMGPLRANGGRTHTHALLPGTATSSPSPAIDAGSKLAIGSSAQACVAGDQRQTFRPVDGNGDGVTRCDIGAFELQPNLALGTFTLTPAEASVQVGERVRYVLEWTVPGPGWRVLDSLQLRWVDGEEVILWVRFQEVPGQRGTFSLVNPRNLKEGPRFPPGSANRLETEAAMVHLKESAVDGPPGSRVALTLEVSFKEQAAKPGEGDGKDASDADDKEKSKKTPGRGYQVEVLAADDVGEHQGFATAGSLQVLPRKSK